MTLTLEIAPEIERALEAKAQRRGLSVPALLALLVQREVAAPDESGPLAAFLAQAQALKSAGADGAALVRAAREERTERLNGATGG